MAREIHMEDLHHSLSVSHNEEFAKSIDYKLHALLALGSNHGLYRHGCEDLFRSLINIDAVKCVVAILISQGSANSKTTEAALRECFDSAFQHKGLNLSNLKNFLLNPNAPPFISPTTSQSRAVSATVPELSTTASTPQRNENATGASTPSPLNLLKPGKGGWGHSKTVHIVGLPDGLQLHRVRSDVERYRGELVAYSPSTHQALAKFPTVAANDMLSARKVVIADKSCGVDDKPVDLTGDVVEQETHFGWRENFTPQAASEAGGEKSEGHWTPQPVSRADSALHTIDWVENPHAESTANNKEDDSADGVASIDWVDNPQAGHNGNEDAPMDWDENPQPQESGNGEAQIDWDEAPQPEDNQQHQKAEEAAIEVADLGRRVGTTTQGSNSVNGASNTGSQAKGDWNGPSSTAGNDEWGNTSQSPAAWDNPASDAGKQSWEGSNKASNSVKSFEDRGRTQNADMAALGLERRENIDNHNKTASSRNPTSFGLGQAHRENINTREQGKTASASGSISINLVESQANPLDNVDFSTWRKTFSRNQFGDRYRRPVFETPPVGTEHDESHPAEVLMNWGNDGTMSPTYLKEQGKMSPPDLDENNVFALTETFPWTNHSIARALVNVFGEDAVTLYSVPLEHDKRGNKQGYKHEKTITHYAQFRAEAAPPREDYELCIVPSGGERSGGWFAKMKPVGGLGYYAHAVFEPGLAGVMDDGGSDGSNR